MPCELESDARARLLSKWSKRPGHRSVQLSLIAILSVALFAAVAPLHWPAEQPLQWDMSHHYLGALEFATALRSGSAARIVDELRQPDLYPPVHSVVFGTWFAGGVGSPTSYLTLNAILYVASALLIARHSYSGALLFCCLILNGALAPTLMVEPLATFFLVASLTYLSFGLEHRSWVPSLGIGLLVGATLLTKYNVGLPLLAAVPLSGFVLGTRRAILRGLCGAAIGGLMLLLFLRFQEDGMTMFRRFAENRENMSDLSPIQRLGLYADIFDERYVGNRFAALLAAGLGAWSLLGRRPVAVASFSYFALSLAAFSMHPYVLSRNLATPAAALAVAFGVGVQRLGIRPRFKIARPILTGACLVLAVSTLPNRREETKKFFPDTDAGLQELGDAIEASFHEPTSMRVIGSFNEFSPGWTQVLAERANFEGTLRFSMPYPLEAMRASRPSAWDLEYRRAIERWAPSGESVVIGIALTNESPLRTEDYERWSEWQQNLVEALGQNSLYSLASLDSLSTGVVMSVFEKLDPPMVFTEGWRPPELWVRWAIAESASVEIPPSDQARRLVYSVATSEELARGQSWSVALNGGLVAREAARGEPWRWVTFEIEIPAAEMAQTVTFAFDWISEDADGRRFALPFQTITLRRVSPIDWAANSVG